MICGWPVTAPSCQGVGQALPLARHAGASGGTSAGSGAEAARQGGRAGGRYVSVARCADPWRAGDADFMSDRAARRLCDRLVALGAVRELTGRDTFRLYGV